MVSISIEAMRVYLSKSIREIHSHRLSDIWTESHFRYYLETLGFAEQITFGGWIFRSEGQGNFGHHTLMFFPEIISPEESYSADRNLPVPDFGLHTICSAFEQIAVPVYFCSPVIDENNFANSINWFITRIGEPKRQHYIPVADGIHNFGKRIRRYNWLTANSETSLIPDSVVPEAFSREHFRITFQDNFMSELSDVNGILRGRQFTYFLEIKEMIPAEDNRVGEYFRLELGSFIKLAFFAKRRNFHSIFVVREIDNPSDKNLVNWLYITFEKMAQFASWNPRGRGGENVPWGQGTEIVVPKNEFMKLDAIALQSL